MSGRIPSGVSRAVIQRAASMSKGHDPEDPTEARREWVAVVGKALVAIECAALDGDAQELICEGQAFRAFFFSAAGVAPSVSIEIQVRRLGPESRS